VNGCPHTPDCLVSAYEAAMMDTCVILRFSGAEDDCGVPVASYEESAPTRCLFGQIAASERYRPEATMSEVVAKLRLPLGTALERRDRVRITHRGGRALERPLEYAVEGDPRELPALLAVDLAEVRP